MRYAEIIVAAGVVLWKGQEFAPIFDAIREAARGSPVEVHWILDAVRQFGAEHVQQVAELAAERAGRGVVAFGIGGSEERGPAAVVRQTFRVRQRAPACTSPRTPAKAWAPESIWAALAFGRRTHRPRHRRRARSRSDARICASAISRSKSASPAIW